MMHVVLIITTVAVTIISRNVAAAAVIHMYKFIVMIVLSDVISYEKNNE